MKTNLLSASTKTRKDTLLGKIGDSSIVSIVLFTLESR